jgi:reductive dehalogenase
VLEVLEGNFVHPKKHKFSHKLEASRVIKRAARLYGVDLVGITKRDPNFDYDPVWDPVAMRSWPWTDFPFEPKSVIVIGFSMDYQAVSTAPSFIADAATGEGYSRIHKSAYQLSVFLKNLGYQAVPVENELGLSVPYAEMAGLGEHGRHGLLITPEFGPRVRLGKVYTDLDYIEYDRPVDLGVTDFCKICKRCAEQCPTKAITFEDDISFEPKYDVEGNWFNNPGVKKFYNNTLLCWQWWTENGDGCSSCIASCPFNKPDFWHHRLIQNINTFAPRPLHSFMRDMDKAFGYGDTFDKNAPTRFWRGE